MPFVPTRIIWGMWLRWSLLWTAGGLPSREVCGTDPEALGSRAQTGAEGLDFAFLGLPGLSRALHTSLLCCRPETRLWVSGNAAK